MPPVNLYTDKTSVLEEAKLSKNTFAVDEVEKKIEETEILIENFTDKNRSATPQDVWLSTDREYPIIRMAARIGSAGFVLQTFGNKMDDGQKKIDNMYKILKNIVYGEGGADGTGSGFPKGDIFITGGAFEQNEFEKLINADINGDMSVGGL